MILDKGKDCNGKSYVRVPTGGACDLSSSRFGKLKPLFRVYDEKSQYWLTLCDCGNLYRVKACRLKNGEATSCPKCKPHKFYKNLAGRTFGHLHVLCYVADRKKSSWLCECDLCGNQVVVQANNLTSGNSTTCGCAKRNVKHDLTGRQFGYWTVLGIGPHINGKPTWHCKCKCGKERMLRSDFLTSSKSLSCGCRNFSKNAERIEQLLMENHIKFRKEVCFADLLSPRGKKLRFDFVIYNDNGEPIRFVEYDGELHFLARDDFGGEQALRYRQICDRIKNEYVHNLGLPIVRIPYTISNPITINDIMDDEFIA